MRIRQSRLRVEEVPAAIERREEFRTGRLQGGYVGKTGAKFGDLPEQYHEAFHRACRDQFTYVVRSSGTPIAWRTFMDAWVVPEGVPGIPSSHCQIVVEVLAIEAAAIDLYQPVG